MSKKPTQKSDQQKKVPFLPIGIFVLIAGIVVANFFFFNQSDSPTEIAEAQLKEIRNGNIDTAYELYSSPQYKKRVSLYNFKKLVSQSPVLWDNRSAHFYDENVHEKTAVLTGVLTANDKSIAPVIYNLELDNGQWQIANLSILESGALYQTVTHNEIAQNETEETTSTPLPSDVRLNAIKQIEGHLKALKSDDINKAYYNYVSKEFTDATPLDSYRDFLKNFPILKTYDSFDAGPGYMKDGFANINITLKSKNEDVPALFSLKQEDGQWKIYGFQLNPSEMAEAKLSPQQREDAVKTIERNLTLLRQGATAQAYEMTSSSFKEATNEDDFRQFVENYPELTRFTSLEFGRASEDSGLYSIKTFLRSKDGTSELEYWLSKNPKDSKFTIWGISIISSASLPKLDSSVKEELSQLIEEQLAAIQEGDLSKAYFPFVSTEFENTVPFEEFKDFIQSFPIFEHHASIRTPEAFQEGEAALVRVRLQSIDYPSINLDYRFIQEGEQWKLWGIQILKDNESEITEENTNADEVLKVVKEQLDAIQENDLSKAYYAYTSRAFQNATSRDQFSLFIQNYPQISKNQGVELQLSDFYNDQANLKILLKGLKTDRTFSYTLVPEGKKWKILSITADFLPGKNQPGEMEFVKAVMGTEVNDDGLVTEPKEQFNQSDREILVNLFIENGQKNTSIDFILKHLNTGAFVEPVTAEINSEGDSIVTLTFTSPPQGWPEGDYELTVKSDEPAVQSVYPFSVK